MKPQLAWRPCALLVVALLGGCSLMPDYQRPASPVAADWPSGAAYKTEMAAAAAKAPAVAAADIAWRDFFKDERLAKVIELAIANNRDLRVSVLNIEKARAQYGIQRAALLPTVTANGNQTAAKVPQSMTGTGSDRISREYDANLAVTAYELDFFGRVRSLSEAALQSYLATEEARRAQQISLVAEVAVDYLTLAADQQRVKLAKDTLESQQQSYDLVKRRFDAGTTSGVSLYEAQASVEAARNELLRYTAAVALDQNALNLVVGSDVPASLLPGDSVGSVTALADVPAGLPSDLLTRRPDVLQAERNLQSANANIGAARAAFLPKVTLTGTAGVASPTLSSLFDSGTSAWTFAPRISVPIFDGGVNSANLTIAEVSRDIAVATYEKSIQTAFREVADALAQRGTLGERLAAQQAQVDASAKSYRIYDARYRLGADSYLNALISLRALYTAQQNLITLQLSHASSRVTLYKVLGGGWRPEGENPAPAGRG
jgi:multidrug efflux system outer membrane protein